MPSGVLNLSDYSAIGFKRFKRILPFNLTEIKACAIQGGIFEIINSSGERSTYPSRFIVLKKKAS